jgi:hypothetical protein
VTEQVATTPDPASVQVPDENVPTPCDQLTVPPGVVPGPASVSVTVAVHVVAVPTGTGVLHATEVELCLAVAAICEDPELPPCCPLPP